MNARLTPGLMALALLVLTLYGPLAEMRSITTDDLQSRDYWLDLGAAAIASFADAAIAIIGVVATALGIPLLRGGGGPAAATGPRAEPVTGGGGLAAGPGSNPAVSPSAKPGGPS